MIFMCKLLPRRNFFVLGPYCEADTVRDIISYWRASLRTVTSSQEGIQLKTRLYNFTFQIECRDKASYVDILWESLLSNNQRPTVN